MTAANDSSGGPPSDPQIRRIEAALAKLGAEHIPPPGWQARVLAAVAEPPRHRPWWHVALPGLLAFAAVLLLVLWPRGGTPMPREPELIASADPAPGAYRGAPGPKLGDVGRLRMTSVARHREVRAYYNGVLHARCAEDLASTTCVVLPDRIQLHTIYDLPGRYDIFGISSDDPLPTLTGNLADDIARVKSTVGKMNFQIQ